MEKYQNADGTTGRFKLAAARQIWPSEPGSPAGDVYETASGNYVVFTADGEWHEWREPRIYGKMRAPPAKRELVPSEPVGGAFVPSQPVGAALVPSHVRRAPARKTRKWRTR